MPHRKASPYWLTFSVLAILVVASVSFAFLFEVQLNTKNEIRKSLFDKAEGEQIKTTRTIAGKIASDLDSIMSRLGQLAATQDLQEGHFTTSSVDALLDEKLNEINSPYSVDSVFIVNDKNILVNITHNNNFTRFLGVDLSAREYVKEVTQTKEPVFSTLFVGADGNHRIAAIYPIINRNTGQMIGAVGASVIATPFFSTYGNIYDFNSSQYINVLDRNAVFAASPNPAIVGQSFYDEKVQTDFIKHSAIINSFYDTILSGQPASTVFDVGFGERLSTGHPVIVNGKPVYFLTVGIPTSLIYSEIDNILASQNNLNYLEWVGLLTAVGFILIFLIRINSRLDKEISNRTQELVDANNQLAKANKQLQEHDKLQKEFINIAAHELRTPITPILMALDLREVKVADGTTQMVLSEDAAK